VWSNLLHSFAPTDVLDIVATSVLIYYLVLLIRGTRAVQILTGVLVLVALLGFATFLNLFLLGTILKLALLGAAVSLPIIFQPELRRALERLGRGGIFRSEDVERQNRTEDRAMSIVARTSFLLSREKIGGLIVIEQQTGLKEFVESGTVLRASLSAELLLSIFSPRSPLHDGATIVREDTVEAAGCLLPLAEQSLGEPRLGTRHRAALGLSEQTDAVVIVISESGTVAVARDGKLTRSIEEESRLFRFLLAATRPHRDPGAMRRDLVRNLRARLTPPRKTAAHDHAADHSS